VVLFEPPLQSPRVPGDHGFPRRRDPGVEFSPLEKIPRLVRFFKRLGGLFGCFFPFFRGKTEFSIGLNGASHLRKSGFYLPHDFLLLPDLEVSRRKHPPPRGRTRGPTFQCYPGRLWPVFGWSFPGTRYRLRPHCAPRMKGALLNASLSIWNSFPMLRNRFFFFPFSYCANCSVSFPLPVEPHF